MIIGRHQRTGGIQDPAQCGLEVPGRRVSLGVEISLDVLDGTFEDEDLITQRVQLVASDDEFVLAQFELFGALACHPVPLATCLAAVLPRTSAGGPLGQRLSTPRALSYR